jgi:hypothetical protein
LKGSDANFVSIGIKLAEIVIHSVEWMDGVVTSTKVERNVEILAARDRPPFVLYIVGGTFDSSIDGIGYFSRDLTKCKTGIEDGHELTLRSLDDKGRNLDGFTVWSDYSIIRVSQRLPMLVFLQEFVNFIDVQLWHRSDIIKAGNNLGNGKLTTERVGGVVFPIQQEGDKIVGFFGFV